MMDVTPDSKWFTFAAKSELYDAFLLRAGFRGAGLVRIDRRDGKASMETLAEAVKTMPARRSVVLFPEGTRTGEASLGPFKAGAVLAARMTGRRILPIVIHRSDRLMPRRAHFPKSGVIRLEVLSAFECDLAASADEDVTRLRDQMMAAFDRG